MRLIGVGAPDETALVPLNTIDVEPTEPKKEPNQRCNCFQSGKYGHYKTQCRKLRNDGYYEIKAQNGATHPSEALKPKWDLCGKTHKIKNCWTGANAANLHRKGKQTSIVPTNKIIETRVYRVENVPNRFEEDFITECNEKPPKTGNDAGTLV